MLESFTESRTVIVTNDNGLHLRPAHQFVELASRFNSRVEVVKDGQRVDGKSVLSMLTLAAVKGCQLVVEATGADAAAAVKALAELVQSGFAQEASGSSPSPPSA
jgi:phosphotransferase system HPr (HPr) family protein